MSEPDQLIRRVLRRMLNIVEHTAVCPVQRDVYSKDFVNVRMPIELWQKICESAPLDGTPRSPDVPSHYLWVHHPDFPSGLAS